MSIVQRHINSIELEFTSLKEGILLLRITIPVTLKMKPMSNWYRLLKPAVATAYEIPLWQVKGSHKIITSKIFDRVLYEWPGGIVLDMPNDATAYDYKIVLAQLDVLKMSRS